MSTYLATVHLLFDLDESDDSEASIPDALNAILTEDMRKYSSDDSCLIDWAFAHGDAAAAISAVDVPHGYEPDESPFPMPADDGWPAANLPAFVYILTIDHRHGTNTSAHRTNEGATADLAAFCRQYAEDDAFILNADKMTDDEIIEAYFAVMNEQDEFYTVERVELLA